VYSLLATATTHLFAKGSIYGPDSVLFTKKPPKYTHEQIVGGLIIDITATCLLLLWMAFIWYRYYGPGQKIHEAPR
jgi:hypothetical protein